MGNELWLCVLIALAFLLIWYGLNKKHNEDAKRIKELEALVEDYEQQIAVKEISRRDAWVILGRCEEKVEEYKKKWANELQKRMQLVELLEKYADGVWVREQKPVDSGDSQC